MAIIEHAMMNKADDDGHQVHRAVKYIDNKLVGITHELDEDYHAVPMSHLQYDLSEDDVCLDSWCYLYSDTKHLFAAQNELLNSAADAQIKFRVDDLEIYVRHANATASAIVAYLQWAKRHKPDLVADTDSIIKTLASGAWWHFM